MIDRDRREKCENIQKKKMMKIKYREKEIENRLSLSFINRIVKKKIEINKENLVYRDRFFITIQPTYV